MSTLFSPYTVKNCMLKNRIVMSPMCMYSVENEDGKVTNWHPLHYGSRAVGGAGLIIVESTAVHPQGRISVKDLGIWSDDHLEGLKKIVDTVHKYDAKIGIQLGHAGRKAVIDGPILAPSPIAYQDDMKQPEEMSKEDIRKTIADFKEGARRAKEAEFDVIELHGAHGYLINEFLSPLSNKRADEYGGSRENRYRFLKEIVEAVNSVWDGPLFVRLSVAEYHPDGNKIDDFIYFSQQMKAQGVDLVDCSSGAIVPAKINVYPGYQVPLAEEIKKNVDIDTGAVGQITEPVHAEEIVSNGRADLVFLARELLRDPYWPLKAAAQLGVSIKGPVQYERGWQEILPK
ncbi:NADPH dehydrogenase NamA [Domibacillus mangrovi]